MGLRWFRQIGDMMFDVACGGTKIVVGFRRFVSKRNKTTNPTVFDTEAAVLVCREGREWTFRGLAGQSDRDRYDKVVGRKLALARAMENAELGKVYRTEVWRGFLQFHAK